ncbi:hypothetical protein [Paenibacillus medicaginis]|uniref:Hydrolase n=1 Tax=Paenibacillus medicaginis TaxID=1470560 RepID=A0ABV5C595_9BACL
MKKLGLSLFFVFVALFMFAGISSADANQPVSEATYSPENDVLVPFAEPGPKYPSINVYMRPGDIIYNPKSISTFFAGHVAIVGPDYKLRHSHPYGPGISETLESYISRFSSGDQFTVLRPRGGIGAAAAQWSLNNINKVKAYNFAPGMADIANNYCSKFVWQAYWYGEHKDVAFGNKYNSVGPPAGIVYVIPHYILDSPDMAIQGVFYK